MKRLVLILWLFICSACFGQIKYPEQVWETTTTTSTGTLSLGGVRGDGYRTFVSGVGDGYDCCYRIDNLSRGGSDVEVGRGTVTDASQDTLSRETVFYSTNSNALVDFGSGTKDVRVVVAEPSLDGPPNCSVKLFGATGDGSTDDTTAIQAAITSAEALTENVSLYFPNGTYLTTDKLTVTEKLELVGQSRNAVIYNTGSDVALSIGTGGTGPAYFVMRNLSVKGDGGEYGDGASGSHGIQFDNARYWVVDNCEVRNHGGSGIYCTGGTWVCRITNTRIHDNVADGINAVSGTTTDGNVMYVSGCSIVDCGDNGIEWCASILTVIGTQLATHKGSGIYVSSNANKSMKAATIIGNYFENSLDPQIYMDVNAANRMECVIIEGNDIDGDSTAMGTGTALIKAVGTANKLRSLMIGPNSYGGMGNALTHAVDLGDCPDNQSIVWITYQGDDTPESNFTNLGNAKVGNQPLINGEITNTVSANAATIDFRTSPIQTLDLSAATDNLSSVTISNDPYQPCRVTLKVTCDNVTRSIASWDGANIYWGDAAQPSWEGGHTVVVDFLYDGSSYWMIGTNTIGS